MVGSRIKFQFQGLTGSRNPGGNDHVVVFDETNFSGYFPANSGIVAITPIQYNPATGAILDADILFNGRDWSFSTDRSPGTFDVQDVATHEIGHFIGLDHSPVVGSSMWPYVNTRQWLHRSLSEDDQAGAVAVAPSGVDGRLNGSLRKADGSALKGGMVAAVDLSDGRLVASTVSDKHGDWVLRGLPSGSYAVYVTPIEGSMTKANLAGNQPIQTGFGSSFYGGPTSPTPFAVSAGSVTTTGLLTLPPDGSMSDNTGSVTILNPGQQQQVTLTGSGFGSGLSAWTLSPQVSVSLIDSGSSWARVLFSVAAGASYGLYDVYLSDSSGQLTVFSGVLDVQPPPPVLTGIDPVVGAVEGGTEVTLSGSGFRDGSYVLFGGREASSVTVAGPDTIVAVAPPGSAGAVDVSVHAPDGQQARLAAAFTYATVPVFSQVFPAAGQAAGGTTLLIGGSGFAPDLVVLLDGQELATTWLSANVVQVTTPAHPAGTVDLALRNPAVPDVVVPDAFTFVPEPDPQVTGFSPSRAKDGGGIRVRLFGSHLDQASAVHFGIDPVTAQGGRPAQALEVLDPATLEAVAPAWRPGSYGIKVTLPNGQGVVAPATFQYVPEAGGGAGGCAGLVRPGAPRSGATDLSALLLAGLGFLLVRRRGAGGAP